MRETHGSAWMANRRRGCGDGLRRFDTQPGEQVSDRGDLEPGACARLRPLVAAREPAPATEAREGVLDLVERPERSKRRRPLGWGLDVELQVLQGGQLGEAAIAAVGDDRLHVGQLIEALIEQLPSFLSRLQVWSHLTLSKR